MGQEIEEFKEKKKKRLEARHVLTGPDGFFWSSFPASVPLRKSERKKM